MNLPKIATDDALLFGSLAAFALGVAFVVGAMTGDALLALGAALVGFGLPASVVIFMAAAEPSK
jgi:hypothetical protein